MAFDKDELDELIEKAGLNARDAKRMHAANGTGDSATPKAPKHGGHGSSRPETASLDF